MGPRRRWLGPAFHLGRVERQQLLGRRLLRPRRTSAQAADDEGVDGHARSVRRLDIEFVRSRQFPESAQGNFLINNVIGFHGIKRYKVAEDGSGFAATEIEPLLQSSDTNFRPVALRFGPGRRALHHRLVQPARGPYAVLAARCPPRQNTRTHLARHREGQAAERVAADPRRVHRSTAGTVEGVRGPDPLSRAARASRAAGGGRDSCAQEMGVRPRFEGSRLRAPSRRGTVGLAAS